MGNQPQKINVAIIREKESFKQNGDLFKIIKENQQFNCYEYYAFDEFLQNQSQKRLNYIIVEAPKKQQNEVKQLPKPVVKRTKSGETKKIMSPQKVKQIFQYEAKKYETNKTTQFNKLNFFQASDKKAIKGLELKNEKNKKQQKSIIAYSYKTLQNKAKLQRYFSKSISPIQTTLKDKLISYIKRGNLDRIKVYLYTKDYFNTHIPDHEGTYYTFVSNSNEDIVKHIQTEAKKDEITNFKFKRLVKDLSRKTMVYVIGTIDQANTSGLLTMQFLSNDISYQKCQTVKQFQSVSVGTYIQFIVIYNEQLLKQLLRGKKDTSYESKIIYYSSKAPTKELAVWYHSDSIKKVVHVIKERVGKLIVRPNLFSTNTIMYAKYHLPKSTQDYLIASLVEKLGKSGWVQRLNLQFADDQTSLNHRILQYRYSFVILLGWSVLEQSKIKHHLRKAGLEGRVYFYSTPLHLKIKTHRKKKNIIEDIVAFVLTEVKESEEVADHIVDILEKKCSFKIKFETAALEQIVTYKGNEKQYHYLQTRMGLRVTQIHDKETFQSKYLNGSNGRSSCFPNDYVICSVNSYLELNEMMEGDNQFKAVNVIIYDEEILQIQELFKEKYEKDLHPRVIFMHFQLHQIYDYLCSLIVPKISTNFFAKKVLPNFIQVNRVVKLQHVSDFKFKGVIISKNEFLKQIFADESVGQGQSFYYKFKRFQHSYNLMKFQLTKFQQRYVKSYARLYQIVAFPFLTVGERHSQVNPSIQFLKQYLIKCIFKCQRYQLIKVSERDLFYFYIDRIKACCTYIELQVACIYMFTLNHGLNRAIDQILSKPLDTRLAVSIFAVFVVVLLSAFLTMSDEVLGRKSVCLEVIKNHDELTAMEVGDVVYNYQFILAGKCQPTNHHRIIFQFDNLPYTNFDRIKSYLEVDRFAFFKGQISCIIAPYTKFRVVRKTTTPCIEIVLSEVCTTGFLHEVLLVNGINVDAFGEEIEKEVQEKLSSGAGVVYSGEESTWLKEEAHSLAIEQLSLMRSIFQAYYYRKFLKLLQKKNYHEAFRTLTFKQEKERTTGNEIEKKMFSKMLGVEKAYVLCYLREYNASLGIIEGVLEYLVAEHGVKADSWTIEKVETEKFEVLETILHVKKLLDHVDMEKKWVVRPFHQSSSVEFQLKQIREDIKAKVVYWSVEPIVIRDKVGFELSEEEFQWRSRVTEEKNQFILIGEEVYAAAEVERRGHSKEAQFIITQPHRTIKTSIVPQMLREIIEGIINEVGARSILQREVKQIKKNKVNENRKSRMSNLNQMQLPKKQWKNSTSTINKQSIVSNQSQDENQKKEDTKVDIFVEVLEQAAKLNDDLSMNMQSKDKNKNKKKKSKQQVSQAMKPQISQKDKNNQTQQINIKSKISASFQSLLFFEQPQAIQKFDQIKNEQKQKKQKNSMNEQKKNNVEISNMQEDIFYEKKSIIQTITQGQKLMGVTKMLQWQVFYFQGQFLLTKRKQHYKKHVPLKFKI